MGESYNVNGHGAPLIAGAGDFGSDTPATRKFTSSPTRLCAEGDIILCVRATIGDLNWADKEYCLGRGVAGLRPHRGDLDARYLWHWLGANKRTLVVKAKGSTFKQVDRNDIESMAVQLPPLPEQQRIAAILDKAHAISRKRQETIALTEQLLRSTFLEMFGDPVTNPKGWPLEPLDSLATVDRGKFSPRPRNDPRYYSGCYPFIQTGDISNGKGVLRSWSQTVNEEGRQVSRAFPAGTIVIAIVGATIGETVILGFESYCPDSVVGIVPDPYMSTPEYLEFFLRFQKPRLQDMAPETARANINLQVLRPLLVPKAPVDDQRRFSCVYHRCYAAIDRMAAHDYSLLFDSLAQRAFRGEL